VELRNQIVVASQTSEVVRQEVIGLKIDIISTG
jgi:hypothetical protein